MRDDETLLMTLGALDWLDWSDQPHHVSAIDIFEDLAVKKGVWYCARLLDVEPGTTALFYLKKVGMIAHAMIDNASTTNRNDNELLARYGIGYFRTKLLGSALKSEPGITVDFRR